MAHKKFAVARKIVILAFIVGVALLSFGRFQRGTAAATEAEEDWRQIQAFITQQYQMPAECEALPKPQTSNSSLGPGLLATPEARSAQAAIEKCSNDGFTRRFEQAIAAVASYCAAVGLPNVQVERWGNPVQRVRDAVSGCKMHADQAAKENAQSAAENSPDNRCGQKDVAAQIIADLTGILRQNSAGSSWHGQVIDMEHLVTDMPNKEGVISACHGVSILSTGESIEGTILWKKNVAGNTIEWWQPGLWRPHMPPSSGD